MGKKTRRWPRWLLAVLAALMLLPYLLPLSAPAATDGYKPFDNSAFLEVSGTAFHVRLFLPPEQEVRGKLLLIHGLGGSTFSFEALAPQLAAAGYLTASVDLPGFGYSGRNLDYDHSQGSRAHDLWQLLSYVDAGLPEDLAAQPWHLAGHSMGGGAVYAMALQDPARARSLVLLDAPLTGAGQGRSFLLGFPPLQQWLQLALEHLLFNPQRIAGFLENAYGRAPTQEEVQGYLAPLLLPGTARSLGQFVRSAREEEVEGLRDLPLPVLAIWGSEDRWVPLSALQALQALRPDLEARIIKGAGHCPMETHTGEVAQVLLDWLAGD